MTQYPNSLKDPQNRLVVAFDHSDPHGDEDRADVLSVLELMDTPLRRIQQNIWRQDRVTFHLLAAQMQVLHFYL